jgi:hypothetical protein
MCSVVSVLHRTAVRKRHRLQQSGRVVGKGCGLGPDLARWGTGQIRAESSAFSRAA